MRWEDGALLLLDQRLLPHEEKWLRLDNWRAVAEAIREMAVRGAPAIGLAGAYGMALAAQRGDDLSEAKAGLNATRPTAVNLAWALEQAATAEDPLAVAQRLQAEDLEMNLAIGRYGAGLIKNGWRVMTVCNTGAIATAGHGTALGMIRTAHSDGKAIFVYSCETRPRQQGLRLTAWELLREGIPFAAIADGAAAWLMRQGKVDCVVVGADRIARNGDTANKIGTYSLAVAAERHRIPFYVAAPSSTLDISIPDGSGIPIEERAAEELTEVDGHRVAPEGCPVENPAFDITPGDCISAIVTERGVFTPAYDFAQAYR